MVSAFACGPCTITVMPEPRFERWSRPRLIAAYVACQWVLTAVAVFAAILLMYPDFKSDPVAAIIQSLNEVPQVLTDAEFWITLLVFGGVILVGQCIMFWPVRRPAPITTSTAGGRSLWLSIGICGLLCGLLWAGVILALLDIPWLLGRFDWHQTPGGPWMLAVAPLSGWAIATPLLARFARGVRRETWLGRVASGLFLGTVVEVIAVIPLYVMMRRKSDCFCERGSFLALLACFTVGLAAFGPAIVLPLIARRRKRWYAGRCECCLYDMSGLPTATRCPECGAGWKP